MSSETREVTWTIGKAQGEINISDNSGEVIVGDTLTFNITRIGDGKVTVISNNTGVATVELSTDSTVCTVNGVSSGNTNIVVSCSGTNNYIASSSKVFAVSVNKKVITVPTVTNTSFTFNDGYQAPTITGEPSSTYAVRTGTISAKNAGNYSIIYTLTNTNKYVWSDGSTAPKTFNWNIAKANPGNFTISSNSVTLNTGTPAQEITVTRVGDGIISVVSNDSTTATVSTVNQSTGKFTITGVKTGNTSVTVSVAQGTNYIAFSSQNISVSVSLAKAFADCTWSEIQQIVQSGKWEENGWNVGDTKDIQFPSSVTLDSGSIPANTTYKVVILGFNHNSSVEGTNRLHLCIGKDASGNDIAFYQSWRFWNYWQGPGYMTEGRHFGGWAYVDTSSLRSLLNTTFFNSLPSDLRSVIVPTDKWSYGYCNNTQVFKTYDKIFIPSEKEIFGTITEGNSSESDKTAQYSYFSSGNGKIRQNHSNISTVVKWYTRSSKQRNVICVSTSGVSSSESGTQSSTNTNMGFIPCFCIGTEWTSNDAIIEPVYLSENIGFV